MTSIITDMDQTLYQGTDITDSLIRGLIRVYMNVPQETYEDKVVSAKGATPGPVLKKFLDRTPFQSVQQTYKELIFPVPPDRNQILKEANLYETHRQLLTEGKDLDSMKDLKARGRQIEKSFDFFEKRGIYTAVPKERANLVLERMGLTEYFDHVITEDDTINKRDTIDGFLEIARLTRYDNKNGVPGSDKVFFMDDVVGYLPQANRAGFTSIHAHEYARPWEKIACFEKRSETHFTCARTIEELG